MTARPRHPKPDANQAEIIGQLRDLGFIVHDVSSLGGDCLDLFVLGIWKRWSSWPLRWSHWEIKVPDGVLTEGERLYLSKVMRMYDGADTTARVGRSLDDILRWYGWRL